MDTQDKSKGEEATYTTPAGAEGPKDRERKPLFEASRRVLLAGIGAIALAQDEIEDFVDRLVERGEIAEKDGRGLVREIMDRRRKTTRVVEEKMGKQVEEILDRLNVPTIAEIEALSSKIAALSRKIDELNRDRGAG